MSVNEELRVWLKIACYSFGGPAAQMAVMHEVLVEEKKIFDEKTFLRALNFCMLLPGPEAQQLVTYAGWLLRGWRGGLLAGGLFILPGFLSILALSIVYVTYQDLIWVQGFFYGLKPALIVIVMGALIKIARRSLQDHLSVGIAVLAFFLLFFMNISFPWIVLGAGLFGAFYKKSTSNSLETLKRDSSRATLKQQSVQTLKTIAVWGAVWLLPVLVFLIFLGDQSVYHQIHLFFSKMSLVSFGGAYAALSYVAQEAVGHYHWLSSAEMLDGLALAETTPGPLIQVVQHVGFLAGYRQGSLFLSPLWGGVLGALLTTWMIFAPCFLWIFTFAPFLERLQENRRLKQSLEMITAAVVGVILNLSLWFSIHTLFSDFSSITTFGFDFELPHFDSVDPVALMISGVIAVLAFYFKRGLFTLLGVAMGLGLISTFYGLR